MQDSKQRWRLLTLKLRVWDGDEKSACFFATGVRPPLAALYTVLRGYVIRAARAA